MKQAIVLPADIYDTLELTALAFGGIGGGQFFEDGNDLDHGEAPLCVSGCAQYAGGYELRWCLNVLGLDANVNDAAVRAINLRRHHELARLSRVSWADYTRELNIKRGNITSGP